MSGIGVVGRRGNDWAHTHTNPFGLQRYKNYSKYRNYFAEIAKKRAYSVYFWPYFVAWARLATISRDPHPPSRNGRISGFYRPRPSDTNLLSPFGVPTSNAQWGGFREGWGGSCCLGHRHGLRLYRHCTQAAAIGLECLWA